MITYHVVSGRDLTSLINEVQLWLDKDWRPQGGIIKGKALVPTFIEEGGYLIWDEDNTEEVDMFYQALIRSS